MHKPNPTFDLLMSWLAYQQFVLRLQLRAKLPRDFAEVMALRGQMRRPEVRCLYELAQRADKGGAIVEIGSFRGLSTVALAKGTLLGAQLPVFAIDPHEYTDPNAWQYTQDDNAASLKNMLFAGVAHLVRPISMYSWDAARGWHQPIRLLWIDGNHEYDAVKQDFDTWSRFVLPRGVVALHDASDPAMGPTRVVQEALATKQFRLLQQVDRVAVLAKENETE